MGRLPLADTGGQVSSLGCNGLSGSPAPPETAASQPGAQAVTARFLLRPDTSMQGPHDSRGDPEKSTPGMGLGERSGGLGRFPRFADGEAEARGGAAAPVHAAAGGGTRAQPGSPHACGPRSPLSPARLRWGRGKPCPPRGDDRSETTAGPLPLNRKTRSLSGSSYAAWMPSGRAGQNRETKLSPTSGIWG